MPQKTQHVKTEAGFSAPEVWRNILDEIRLLRQDLSFLLFQDDVQDYDNAEQIKQSYRRAVKDHPPTGR